MTTQFKKGKIPGIRYREHPDRKNGIQKDRYYCIYYQLDGKQKDEGVGWSSEGWNEKKVAALLLQIKENIKLGKSPRTFKEMREMNEKTSKAQEQQAIETESERITLRETFDKYFEVHKTETTQKTWENTERYYRNWIDEKLGNKKLIDITVDDIQPIITQAVETRTSRTADFVKTVFRQIFNFAKKRDLYFKDNPAMKIKIKMKDNKRNRFLTKEEARILLDELMKRSIDVHDMALLSLYAGLRAGEIFNLQWEHIVWNNDRLIIADPKNGESRLEPMHEIVKEMLKRRQKTDSLGYVFKSRIGGKIEDLSDTFQRTVDALGFNDGITDSRQKVVFHTLRHTYASWLVMAGNDLYTTQKLMGHKSNQMTQRYAHLAPEYLEKAVNRLKRI